VLLRQPSQPRPPLCHLRCTPPKCSHHLHFLCSLQVPRDSHPRWLPDTPLSWRMMRMIRKTSSYLKEGPQGASEPPLRASHLPAVPTLNLDLDLPQSLEMKMVIAHRLLKAIKGDLSLSLPSSTLMRIKIHPSKSFLSNCLRTCPLLTLNPKCPLSPYPRHVLQLRRHSTVHLTGL